MIRCNNVTNELVLRVGLPFLDNYYKLVINEGSASKLNH